MSRLILSYGVNNGVIGRGDGGGGGSGDGIRFHIGLPVTKLSTVKYRRYRPRS